MEEVFWNIFLLRGKKLETMPGILGEEWHAASQK